LVSVKRDSAKRRRRDAEPEHAYANVKRTKRAVIVSEEDIMVDFKAYRCFYAGCAPPPDPLAPMITPANAVRWSLLSSWGFRNDTKPVAGDTVVIPYG
jgi:hypothetical protein